MKINGQNCDYFSEATITEETKVARWSTLGYECVLKDVTHIKQGHLQHRDYVGDALILPSVLTHLLDGSSFQVRVLPAITSISHHRGNIGGGLVITVKGTGWHVSDTQIFVDNV